MTIKTKLMLLGIGAALAMFAMLALQRYSVNSTTDLEQELVVLSKVEAGMLTLRRNEKDFLARKDMKYLEKFSANYESLQQKVSRLKLMLIDSGFDTTTIVALNETLEEYQNDFVTIVKKQQEIGLHHKDGLYGALRDAVHAVEAELKSVENFRLLKDMLMLRRNEKDFMLRLDLKYLKKFDGNMQIFRSDLETSKIATATKQSILEKLNVYERDFRALVEGEKQKGLSSKQGLHGQMRDVIHRSETQIDELEELVKAANESLIQNLTFTTWIASLVLIALMVGFILLISRSISRPVASLSNLMSRASQTKDLSLRANIKGKDEIASMGGVFDQMMGEFQGMMNRVLNSSTQLSHAAEELSSVMEETSHGVLRQQNESDQVATAMNEMSATVQEVARHAGEAANASRAADEEASKGKQVVSQAVRGIQDLATKVEGTASVIHELEKESENIGTVLSVIQGIAEQTNLLALNAAIEAARAGESGRGFAVVADEVRTLAQRSKEATEEIKSIIERLQSRADNAVSAMQSGMEQTRASVEQVESAGHSLEAITAAVVAINDMNRQIASAAEEQSAVSEEINRNIVNITQVANETAKGAARTTDTSGKLAKLAMDLQHLINEFKIDGSGALDLSKAKTAHRAWKTRLRAFLDGKEALTREQAVSHKHCDLGKWYYSEGLASFGDIAAMRKLEEPHAELHALIKAIVEAKESGDSQEAEALYKKVEPLSEKIIGFLNQVEQEASR